MMVSISRINKHHSTPIAKQSPSRSSGRSLDLVRKILFLLPLLIVCFVPSSVIAEPPFVLPPREEIMKLRSCQIFTNKGSIIFELYPQEAPWHVANFKYLADRGFYRGLKFDYFQPDYIIQIGKAPGGTPKDLRYSLQPEFSSQRHSYGALGMSRISGSSNPQRRSHSTQFYIILGPAPHMNSSYTVFGRVIDGSEVLDSLRSGDVIEDLKVYVRD